MIMKVVNILIAIAAVVVCYYLIEWVLTLLGIQPPVQLMRAVFVLIALVAIAGAWQRNDWWWGSPRV